MHDTSLSYLGQKDSPSFNEVAVRAGVDRGNLKEQVEKSRRTGEPLSKKLEAVVFDALCAIHEEYPLHSYPRFVMTTLRVMRECETTALTRFKSAAERLTQFKHDEKDNSKSDRVQALKEAFETAARQVTDPFYAWITAALRLLGKDDSYTDEELGTLNIGAAALQTIVELWEDAATAITDLQPDQDQSAEAVINFEYMDIDGLITILDVVDNSLSLYEELDADFTHRLRSAEWEANKLALKLKEPERNTEEKQQLRLSLTEAKRRSTLLEHDRQIVSVQLAALGSHALDWLRATPELLSRMGLAMPLIHETVQRLYQRTGTAAVEKSAALLERHPHNLVLARNVILMARQIGVEGSAIEKTACEHVATLLNITTDEVYSSSKWLVGRKALLEEPPFKTVQPS